MKRKLVYWVMRVLKFTPPTKYLPNPEDRFDLQKIYNSRVINKRELTIPSVRKQVERQMIIDITNEVIKHGFITFQENAETYNPGMVRITAELLVAKIKTK
jgi:hypothetical protein